MGMQCDGVFGVLLMILSMMGMVWVMGGIGKTICNKMDNEKRVSYIHCELYSVHCGLEHLRSKERVSW